MCGASWHSEGDSRPAAKLPTMRIHKDEAPPAQEEPETVPQAVVEDGSPSDSGASTDPMVEEGTPSATGASTDPMAEEGTPSATGASTDPMAEEGTPSATGASMDPMVEEGTPSATGASTDPMAEEGTPSATGASTDPMAEEGTPSATGASKDPMVEEGTPSATGASTDPMVEEGTPSATRASTDPMVEEGTPSATGASTDGGPLCTEVADEQSVTSDQETRPAGTPSARKGEGSDIQKAPHNSSTGEERPIERTKSPCRRKGMREKGTGAAAPRPISCDHPVIVEDLVGRTCQTPVPGLEEGRNMCARMSNACTHARTHARIPHVTERQWGDVMCCLLVITCLCAMFKVCCCISCCTALQLVNE